MFRRENFKKIRKEQKISQGKLANLIGRSQKTIYRWEIGTRLPTLSEIHVVAKIFNVDINELSTVEIDFTPINSTRINSLYPDISFVDKIESSLSIQDRVFLNGINTELQNLKDKIEKLEKKAPPPDELIIDSINSYVYKKDLNGKFTYINKPYAKYLDVEIAILQGKTNREVFDWRDAEELDKLEAEAIKKHSINNSFISIPGSSGRNHGLFSSSSIYDPDGLLKEIVIKIDDITNELEAVDMYKTLENVIHSSNEILWIKAKDGRYSFVGAPVLSVSGYNTNDILNSPKFWLTDIVYEFDREKVGEFYSSFEDGASMNYRIKTKDNQIKYVKEKIFRRIKLTFGIIQDITNELEAQEDKQLLLDIIDEMPEPIAVIKNFGKDFAVCSSSLEKMLETSNKTLEKVRQDLTNLIHVDDRQKVVEYLNYLNSKAWWKNETKKSMHEEIKYRIRLKSGKIRWIRIATYSTAKLKKQGIRFAILKDITKEQEKNIEMQYLFECVNDMDSMFWAAQIIDNEKNKFEYITVTEGVKKIYGLTKVQFAKQYKTLKDILSVGDNLLADEQMANLSFPHNQEHKIELNGQTKWLQERIYKKYDLIFGIVRDITEEKSNAKKRELLEHVISSYPACYFITRISKNDPHSFSFEYISNYAEKMLLYEKKDFFEDNLFFSRILHPHDKERIEKWWQSELLPDSPDCMNTYRIIRGDGSICHVEDHVYNLKMPNRNRIRLGILKEIDPTATPQVKGSLYQN